MRPIDGDVLEEAFEQLADKLRHDGRKTDAQLLEALAAIVKFCPTLDVEPIRHGHWEAVNEFCGRAHEFKCTACKRSVHYEYFTRFCDYDFCPWCNAKMDEAPAVDSPAVDNPAVDSPAVDSPAVDKGADVDGT